MKGTRHIEQEGGCGNLISRVLSRCYMPPLMEKGLVARTEPENPMSPGLEYKLI